MQNYNERMKMDNTISIISRIKSLSDSIIVQELEKRGHTGLAPSHGNILQTLISSEELTKTEIASRIKKEKNTVTSLIKKLKDLGYIETKVNEEDARSTIVFLTQKGIAMKEDFLEISEKLYDIQFEQLEDSQIKAFKMLLEIVHDNFERNS